MLSWQRAGGNEHEGWKVELDNQLLLGWAGLQLERLPIIQFYCMPIYYRLAG